MPTDTSEKGLETLIIRHLTGCDGVFAGGAAGVTETPAEIAEVKASGSGWFAGSPADYDRGHALDVAQLFAFLQATQPENLKKLAIGNYPGHPRQQPPEVPVPPFLRDRPARRHRCPAERDPGWSAALRPVLRHPFPRQ